MNQYRYQRLLSPFRITPKYTLKNRMISSHVPPFAGDGPLTFPDAGIRAHYRRIAENGCSMLIVSMGGIRYAVQMMMDILRQTDPDIKYLPDTSDMAHSTAARYDKDDPLVQNTYCRLANEIHSFGTYVMLDLDPVMPEGTTYGGGPFINQTVLGDHIDQLPPSPKETFPDIINDAVNTCKQFRQWGWDGVSINLMNYLNRSMNIRTDEYGGCVENRARFMTELLTAIREAMGPDFIIHIYMPGESRHGSDCNAQEGYPFEDAVEFARLIENTASILELRADNMTIQCVSCYNQKENQSYSIDYCRRMKEAGVKIPLSCSGSNQDPELMEEALRNGWVDLFSISRAWFVDYDFFNKIKEGRGEDIVPCLHCNKCQGPGRAPWLQQCALNPRFGMNGEEAQYDRAPRSLKKVAVIGGGPAGMRTALFAAEKGHSVTLYEKTGYLGGQMEHAEYYSFKWPIKRYRDWLVRQIGKAGVQVVLNCEPSVSELTAQGYEAVFACTGSTGIMPNIEGVDDPAIYNSRGVWGHEEEMGQHVVIVGGSEVGMEAAIDLAQRGKDVTVLTRQDELGHDCGKLHYITMTTVIEGEDGYGMMVPEWEKYNNLKGITEAKTIRVTPNSVTYVKDGQQHTITCDTVVVGGGGRPNIDSAIQYAAVAPEFYMVGDVEGNSKGLETVNRRAYVKANLL